MTPIERLPRGTALAEVRVAGRVVLAEPGRAQVADMTGQVEVVHHGEALPGGAWVRVAGRFDGARIEASEVRVDAPGRGGDFPPSEGEWMAMHGPARRAASLRARARVTRAIRSYFDDAGLLEVETPLAVPSPGLDLHLAAFEVRREDAARYLITSPEYQMKRLIAGGLTDIYQLCRCFRRDEAGAHHQPEFTMLEWYRGFATSEAIMADTERLVANVAEAVVGGTAIEARGRGEVDVRPPWPRVPVADALLEHAEVELADVLPERVSPDAHAQNEARFFELWVDRVEPRLGRGRPVFVTHWPASMASLAKLHDDDPRFADRIEAYVDGLELCNGFSELTDPVEQRARLERDRANRRARGLEDYPIDERFLDALVEGLPPSAGNALGVDRLVMLLLGIDDIRDVIAFPDDRL